MKAFLSDKTGSFYLLGVAVILAVIALIIYQNVEAGMFIVNAFLVADIVLVAGGVAVMSRKAIGEVSNLIPTVAALLVAAALFTSISSQIEYIGWFVSGLYTLEQILPYILYVIVLLIALIANLAATFMDLRKSD